MGVAQLVRVEDCGSLGRGFEPHLPPVRTEVADAASVFRRLCTSGRSAGGMLPTVGEPPRVKFFGALFVIMVTRRSRHPESENKFAAA